MSEENMEIEISHEKEEGFEIHAINGAQGGITSRGDFLIRFFHEHKDIPEIEKVKVDEDGEIESSEYEDEGQSYTRNMKMGISLSPENALSIANWIIDHVEDYQEAKNE